MTTDPLLGQSASQYARRLLPAWWIKRRMNLRRLPRGGWQAWYRHRGEVWSATGSTRDEAAAELLTYIEGVRDGSILAEYYANRETS